jgi:hypothetical protein
MFDLAQSERGGAVSEAAQNYRNMLLANYPGAARGSISSMRRGRLISAWAPP